MFCSPSNPILDLSENLYEILDTANTSLATADNGGQHPPGSYTHCALRVRTVTTENAACFADTCDVD